MIFSSSLLENAVNEFAKLPGSGKKTALRLVLHLLKKEVSDVKGFSDVILKMREEIHFCSRCKNISDKSLCNICENRLSQQHIICVV
jgi:recombination protein RecR